MVSACSNVCYDPGETSNSGVKAIDVLGVRQSDAEKWIESDIVLNDGQELPIDVFGIVNICPPADQTDCSSASDFCTQAYFYPSLCNEHNPDSGSDLRNTPVILSSRGFMACSDQPTVEDDQTTSIGRSKAMFVFDKKVHAGDSIVVELVPVRNFDVTQNDMGTGVSCSCLIKGNCTDDPTAVFYNSLHVRRNGTKALYKSEEVLDSNGNVVEYRCTDDILGENDLHRICAYGGNFCFLSDNSEKKSLYSAPVVSQEKKNALYASRFNYPLEGGLNGHIPNFLGSNTQDFTQNSGLLIDYSMADLRDVGFANSMIGYDDFSCVDVRDSSAYIPQFSFYEANLKCDLVYPVAPSYNISLPSGSAAVVLPGPILGRSEAESIKISDNVSKGYSNSWIPLVELDYHTSDISGEVFYRPGTVFAPIVSDTDSYIGDGYPYKIPDDDNDGKEVWISLHATQTGYAPVRGGMLLKVKRYCIYQDGEKLYAHLANDMPDHEPGDKSEDISMKVEIEDIGDGISETKPIMLKNETGEQARVYFGIRNATVGNVNDAHADNNFYSLQYQRREYKPIISTPINALVDFVNDQLFGDSFAEINGNNPGIIGPMYRVFAESLGILFFYCLIIYLIIYGMMLMIGLLRNLQSTFIINVAKLSLIAFLVNSDSWNVLAGMIYRFFVLGVEDILNSTVNSIVYVQTDFVFLDATIGALFDFTTILRVAALLISGPVGFIICVIILHGLFEYMKAMFSFVMQYIMIIFAYGWLIFLAPLFVMCLMFEVTKDMFMNWLKMLVNFSLQLLFMFVMIGMLNAIMLYSIYKLLMFGICGNECVLYIKFGELGGQDIGFCLFSFFLPQGYDASIAASQYMTSISDPMTNFFGLPFGIVHVMLFYLSSFVIGKFLSIAELMAQTISGSMASVESAVSNATEAIKWTVGSDRETQQAMAKAAASEQRQTRDASFDAADDDAQLNTNAAPRAGGAGPGPAVAGPAFTTGGPAVAGGVGAGNDEEPDIPPADYDEEPDIPPADYDEEPDIPLADYDEEPDIPPADYDEKPLDDQMDRQGISDLVPDYDDTESVIEDFDEGDNIEAREDYYDSDLSEKSDEQQSAETEDVQQAIDMVHGQTHDVEEEELSELERAFKDRGRRHGVSHLKEHVDDASLEGSQTTSDEEDD
ncbi:hypothetical protein GUI12_04670 [Anaplasmataceae bacterium AB001_6]|nr:hypothetical protein GUI12_04670 [Anaplasmataceae bacterium AB001_6]